MQFYFCLRYKSNIGSGRSIQDQSPAEWYLWLLCRVWWYGSRSRSKRLRQQNIFSVYEWKFDLGRLLSGTAVNKRFTNRMLDWYAWWSSFIARWFCSKPGIRKKRLNSTKIPSCYEIILLRLDCSSGVHL